MAVVLFGVTLVTATVVGAPAADASTSLKMPWAEGDQWIIARGPLGHLGDPGMLGSLLYWDLVQFGGASPDVIAAADGTAKFLCGPDERDQAAVVITLDNGFKVAYLHLSGSAARAAGITASGVHVDQGDPIGRIYPSAGPFGSTCGFGSGEHLHFELSSPATVDGVSMSMSGPNSGVLSSTNEPAPDAPSGAQLATERDGTIWMSAVDANGTLYTREGPPSGWQGRVQQGTANSWISADIVVDKDDHVWLIGVKQDGRVFARRRTSGWEGWVELGSGAWSTASPPAVTARDGGGITVGLVKASGTLYTRNWLPNSGWGAFSAHGSGDWVSVDVAGAQDGDIWLLAVKEDGRAYIRRGVSGSGWNALSYQGSGWSTEAPPAITPRAGAGITYAMVKSSGSLQTRYWIPGTSWSGFTVHGSGSWATVDVSLAQDGDLWLVAVKQSGTGYVRRGVVGSGWNPFSLQGSGAWATEAPPAITPRAGAGITYSLLKESGSLYTRNWTPSKSWSSFELHYALNSWAA